MSLNDNEFQPPRPPRSDNMTGTGTPQGPSGPVYNRPRPSTPSPSPSGNRRPGASGSDPWSSLDDQKNEKPKKKKPLLIIGVVTGAVLLAIAVVLLIFMLKSQNELKEAQEQAAQAQLDMEQMQLQQDYDALNSEFAQFENQRALIMDDSLKRDLTEKYETARLQVEKLQQQLRDSKQRSAAEITKLKNEIETLRALLRHYVEEINRLNQENEALRNENAEIRQENEHLSSRVVETSRQNEQLTERMTLAEKLNVTGTTLTPLNKKGKREKKVQKAVQMVVSFTIPQNNSTPVGEKTIYMRLISPSGQLLGNGGTFSFEGATVQCTARKVIEYTGEEMPGVTIYYDVTSPLTPGDYTVELFADNFRLISRVFNLK